MEQEELLIGSRDSDWADSRQSVGPESNLLAEMEFGLKRGNQMKFLLTLAMPLSIAVFLTAAAVSLGDGVPAAVHYIDHDKVSATMALAGGGAIVNDPGLVMLAQRRAAGEVEYHERTNHIFIMVEGEATFVTGGKMIGAERTGPDQIRAKSIEGGEIHHLSKGDVITIPAKTPHWWKEVPTKTVAYYAVNIESQ
jgi:mannose-6-phosphate isomerase-like protein (cupin superfamily)